MPPSETLRAGAAALRAYFAEHGIETTGNVEDFLARVEALAVDDAALIRAANAAAWEEYVRAEVEEQEDP